MENLKEISTVDLINELKHRKCVGLTANLITGEFSQLKITIEVPTSQVGEIFNTNSED